MHASDRPTEHHQNQIYSPGESFTVNLDIVDAINMTSIVFDMTWTPAVLTLTSANVLFDGGTFLGSASDWLVAAYGVAGYNLSYTGAGTGPSGSGTIAQYTFTVISGSSWICPEIPHLDFEIGGERILVETPIKNAWFVAAPAAPPPVGGQAAPIIIGLTSSLESLISIILLVAIVIPLVATIFVLKVKKKKQ